MPKDTVSIIGNLAIDRVYIGKSLVGLKPGGTAFYGGMALARLKADVELVSKIGVHAAESMALLVPMASSKASGCSIIGPFAGHQFTREF